LEILQTHPSIEKLCGKGVTQGMDSISSLFPNQTHQADLVGPRYLKDPVRFYSLNIVDTATVRCALHPSRSKSGQTLDGFRGAGKRND
jgi:putative transposase